MAEVILIICFECNAETKHQLDSLVSSGQYKDYSEAIKVALANQSLLHQKIADQGPIVVMQQETADLHVKTSSKNSTSHIVAVDYTSKKIIESAIPDIFRISRKPLIKDSAPMPDDTWSGSISVPVERWIFGQYNKLFPMKASCRALANLLSSKHVPNWDYFSQTIAMQAMELGRYLLHHDLECLIPRDERLSTAFPTPDPASEKSRDRYAKQFVFSVNKSGQPSSLLVDFKFLNFTRDKQAKATLTEPGWHFALIENPVLDGKQQNPLERFSKQEQDFLIEHILCYVPVERFAYHTILYAISNGENTPEKLNNVLQTYVREPDSYKPSFLAAQRSGAISRMADINLLTRSRDGVRVTYEVTQAGHDFIKRCG